MDLNISQKAIVAANKQYATLQPTLEAKYPGQFVVIDPISKEYFVSPFLADAFRAGKNKLPNRLFYSFKIGSETTTRMG